jgi:hypothetical protein
LPPLPLPLGKFSFWAETNTFKVTFECYLTGRTLIRLVILVTLLVHFTV